MTSEARCGCEHARPSREGGWRGRLASVAPLLACALCPACLTVWSTLLSAVGVQAGLAGMGEEAHGVVLGVAVLVAMGVAAWRAISTRDVRPALLPAAGCGMLVAAHALDVESLEWAGVAALLGAALLDHLRHRRQHRLGDAH